ncbi:hypothetical protein EVAR_81340_1 [Eumeta japonica]|uniref:Uncharacterized protein n=1 Tax=Eumeta variegata TaxID=151549 RepID=A0A4C1XDD9_EUMVA|nr:hypothetical protein EVAR_81340_1 [Eumeta japonica]
MKFKVPEEPSLGTPRCAIKAKFYSRLKPLQPMRSRRVRDNTLVVHAPLKDVQNRLGGARPETNELRRMAIPALFNFKAATHERSIPPHSTPKLQYQSKTYRTAFKLAMYAVMDDGKAEHSVYGAVVVSETESIARSVCRYT